MTPQRLARLVAFLESLGLDPAAPGGPGATAGALEPVEEALTHSSCREPHNHERLEFFGDAVLRLAATDFLRREHGRLRVGEQSALRSQLVSDRWLAELAEGSHLATVVRLGPMASGDAAGRATVLAECTEALIGAIYLAWGGATGGLEPVIRWLSPHWRRTSDAVLADPHRRNWKSALQEWSQSRGLGLPHYSCSENSLDHGDPMRFHCVVNIVSKGSKAKICNSLPEPLGDGWGSSRRFAQQNAAQNALARIQAVQGVSGC